MSDDSAETHRNRTSSGGLKYLNVGYSCTSISLQSVAPFPEQSTSASNTLLCAYLSASLSQVGFNALECLLDAE